MKTHIDNTKENKGKAVANSLIQKKEKSESTFHLIDNRPEAIAQRKLKEMSNKSLQVKQLKKPKEIINDKPQVTQLKGLNTTINSSNAPIQFNGEESKKEKSKRKKDWRRRRDLKQAGKSAGPISEVAVSKTKLPYQSDEVSKIKLKPTGKISPHKIRTAQNAASEEFADGGRIMDVVSSIKKGKNLPAIEIYDHNGQLYTLDHRRLYAYRRANKPIPYIYKDSNKSSKDFSRKFSSKDQGMSMSILPSRSDVVYEPQDVELDDEYDNGFDDQYQSDSEDDYSSDSGDDYSSGSEDDYTSGSEDDYQSELDEDYESD